MLSTTWVKEWRSGILKCRLCVRPFGREAKSRSEVFAPTPVGMTTKVALVRAHVLGHTVRFFDVSRAFLHTPIRDDAVFVEAPPEAQLNDDEVWWVGKAMYGLEESPADFDDHFGRVVSGAIADDEADEEKRDEKK